MRDFRWELTRLSDLKYDPEKAWRHDLDYRRGCDQTASRIMDHVARLADKKEIVRALHAWTDVLEEMRYDGQQHLLLLDEEIAALKTSRARPVWAAQSRGRALSPHPDPSRHPGSQRASADGGDLGQ